MAAISAPTDRHERHSSRSIDIIIHGATGYTGKRVVLHLAKRHPNLNIAICGRNSNKLNAVATELGWDESKCQSSTFVVEDIVEGASDLIAAFSNAKVVIACAGPYRQCGLPILKVRFDPIDSIYETKLMLQHCLFSGRMNSIHHRYHYTNISNFLMLTFGTLKGSD